MGHQKKGFLFTLELCNGLSVGPVWSGWHFSLICPPPATDPSPPPTSAIFLSLYLKSKHSKKYAAGLWSIRVTKLRRRCSCAFRTSTRYSRLHWGSARTGWREAHFTGENTNNHAVRHDKDQQRNALVTTNADTAISKSLDGNVWINCATSRRVKGNFRFKRLLLFTFFFFKPNYSCAIQAGFFFFLRKQSWLTMP